MDSPFGSEPERLSVDTLATLISGGRLTLLPCSPFGFVRAPDTPSSTVGPPLSAATEAGLAVLASPDARIRISSQHRSDSPAQVVLFRRGDQVAQGGFDRESLFVGAPIAIPLLADTLVERLASQPLSTDRHDFVIAPKVLVGISWLWSFGQSSAKARVRSKDLQQRLAASRVEDPEALLAELLATGVLDAVGDAIGLGREWIPWLSRVWSQEYVEVELSLLAQDRVPTSSDLEGARERLFFVGARNERLLFQCAPVDDRRVAGNPSQTLEPNGMRFMFSHLTNDELHGLLSELLTRSATSARDGRSATADGL